MLCVCVSFEPFSAKATAYFLNRPKMVLIRALLFSPLMCFMVAAIYNFVDVGTRAFWTC